MATEKQGPLTACIEHWPQSNNQGGSIYGIYIYISGYKLDMNKLTETNLQQILEERNVPKSRMVSIQEILKAAILTNLNNLSARIAAICFYL